MERKLLNLWVNRISVMVASVMVSRLKSYVVQVDLAQPDEGPKCCELYCCCATYEVFWNTVDREIFVIKKFRRWPTTRKLDARNFSMPK